MPAPKVYFKTKLGRIHQGDSLDLLSSIEADSVNLIVTSPPFGLVRKKDYGNVDADDYVEWFKPFAKEFYRVMADTLSLSLE